MTFNEWLEETLGISEDELTDEEYKELYEQYEGYMIASGKMLPSYYY